MKSLLFMVALFPSLALAAATAVVTPGTWDLYRGSTIAQSGLASQQACVDAAIVLNVKRNYTCRTRTQVAVTVTATPTPVNCVVSAWSADTLVSEVTNADGSKTQTWTHTRTVTTQPANGGTACPVLTETWTVTVPASPVDPPVTGTVYTDLLSAPVGAIVSVYSYSPDTTPTNIRLGSFVQDGLTHSVGGQSITVPVHAGRVLSATAATLASVWSGIQAGDVVELAAGNYTGTYGEGTWTMDSQLDTFKQGTAAQPIALMPSPGAVVTFTSTAGHANFTFGDGNGAKARYITITGLNIVCRYECVTAGGDTSTATKPESGGDHIRLVANDIRLTDANANTQTGLVSIQGDGWQVLGNAFHDPSNRAVINNNHVVYIQNGADDVEVAYNNFTNLHVGFVVQIHQDGTGMLYERLSIHDNFTKSSNINAMRGFTASGISDQSTVTFANNYFENVGWADGWGCVNVYAGRVTMTNNTCISTANGVNMSRGPGPTLVMDRNKLCPAPGYLRINYEGGASASQVTETNIRSCQ